MDEVILGIDVSKKELSITLLFNTYYKKYKISNNIEGFIDLIKWLQDQVISKVKACMESMGLVQNLFKNLRGMGLWISLYQSYKKELEEK
ncbi:MAG: hypothetical protein J0H12_03430 [Candidatus Paracaedimonas acanthamoebae]|uniref:Uncharacterized protein n=1 Tax=Candidatus Paracaedimonas acanthamoebae TaxID=244581 RepID=A0A8J7PXU6_9PROT|nr:hypothetical protein [Candidatus Paracaedimonas acanthamoebae]